MSVVLNLIAMNAKMNWKDSPPHHKQIITKEIDNGNDGNNEKADDKDSKEDNGGITMECNFVLKYAGTDKEQLVMLSEKHHIRTCVVKWMKNMDFIGL